MVKVPNSVKNCRKFQPPD